MTMEPINQWMPDEEGEFDPNPQNPQGEGLDDDTIREIIEQESENTIGYQEAEGIQDPVQPPEEDIYSQAVKALTSEPEPQYVDKSYLDSRLGRAIDELKETIDSRLATNVQEPEVETTAFEEEKAVEMMLSEGTDLTPEELEVAKARYRHFKEQAKKSEDNPVWREEVNAKLDRLLEQPAPQQHTGGWTEDEVANINNAVAYLTAASGLNFDLTDPQQAGALIQGLTPGEDKETAIRKINDNINAVKSRLTAQQVPEQTIAANVPTMGGAPTSNDTRTFSSREELLVAIEDGEVPISDYERIVATI